MVASWQVNGYDLPVTRSRNRHPCAAADAKTTSSD
jgi:hypothetical protein